MFEEQILLETLVVVRQGRVVGLAKSEETLDFFEKQIEVRGLTDFHLTIKGGLSNEEKLDLLVKEIEHWDKQKVRIITDL